MVYEKSYWDSRYSNGGDSGYGSYGEQLLKKLSWLSGFNVKSISEIGCGDLNFGRNLLQLYPHASYAGQDISSVVLEKNSKISPELMFVNSIEDLPDSDLLLCVDVLFHVLDEQELEHILSTIEQKWTKYLAITAYERDEPKDNHVRIRKFDYKRFGEPLIRQVVEEDGQLYFYLFKRPVDLRKVSCCLNTKDGEYPAEILEHLKSFNFGEIIIQTNSDSPHGKYKAFEKAKFDLIYYQDDDAICPVAQLATYSDPEMINVAMKPSHFEGYKNTRMTMGLGWGSIFPKKLLDSLSKYTDRYGEDEVFMRETERILTYLNYPQNRFTFPIIDLPSATAPDRLYRQPKHYDFIPIVEQRCKDLID